MDSVEQLLTDIHAKLDTLQQPIPWVFGRIKRNELQKHPAISWVEPGGDFGGPQKIGGIEGDIGTLVPSLEVQIWGADREACRAILLNLVRAVRATAYGPNVEWLDYTQVNETTGEYAKHGWQLTARIALKLPIKVEQVPTADLQQFDHVTTIAVRWGRFNWGDGHLYGGEPVC